MNQWIRPLFLIAGLYDLIIGLVFLIFGEQLFDWADVTHPNHWGYIQFGALLLMIFGLMFFAIALRPSENRNLIPYGILLKIAYTATAVYYWVQTDIPMLFKPFAIIDLVLLVLFAVAYQQLSSEAKTAKETAKD